MLFDLRGKRKRVIQVIYVLLALIMVASLVVIGLPGNISPFSNGGGAVNQDAAQLSRDRAENLEAKLATQPNSETIQTELVRARLAAGQQLYSRDETTGQLIITPEATEQFELAAEAWEKYLKKTDQPDPALAQQISQSLYSLAEGSTVAQFESNIAAATRAQQIVADAAIAENKKGNGAPPVAQLATLVEFQYLNQDPAAAKKTAAQVVALSDKTERKQIQQQLDSFEKNGKAVGKQLAAAKKQAKQDGGKSLQDPAGSLGTQDALGAATATP